MTETQTSQLLALRPQILTGQTQTPIEEFQNKSLRPILKLQNDLLIKAFRQYIEKHKSRFDKLNTSEKNDFVIRALRQDHQFRHFLRGVVVGHFTDEEWLFFELNENEVNKRTMKLVEQRLLSQLEVLSLNG
ncbi:glyoxalase [Dyadobacter psychrotolerans]|uniref:Glyoxalase n=1 Tax=Dyadobacter psychrotolerans TaxID=2541721 RepID=A0A4R5DTL5_9BACT|nr:glyoxalase [Dyadobacter psychrotolerans]TDE15431.1 glyoxalase [Dyadobacter psychrotolerans]